MCRGLEKDTNLISGFMGSEIIRGPSYSSQVTLTKFAADIGLAKTKEEIKLLIQEFQTEYPFLDDTVVNQNIDKLVDLYADYSKIGKQNSNRNTSIFKYLFLEKYPKIYASKSNKDLTYGFMSAALIILPFLLILGFFGILSVTLGLDKDPSTVFFSLILNPVFGYNSLLSISILILLEELSN